MKSRQLHTQNWDLNDKVDKVSSIIQYELPRNTTNIFNFLHDPPWRPNCRASSARIDARFRAWRKFWKRLRKLRYFLAFHRDGYEIIWNIRNVLSKVQFSWQSFDSFWVDVSFYPIFHHFFCGQTDPYGRLGQSFGHRCSVCLGVLEDSKMVGTIGTNKQLQFGLPTQRLKHHGPKNQKEGFCQVLRGWTNPQDILVTSICMEFLQPRLRQQNTSKGLATHRALFLKT